MHQWLLFEMSKNSLEEKLTEGSPKGTGSWEPWGARVPETSLGTLPELQKLEPRALPDATGLSQPLNCHSCLSCLFLWAWLPPAPPPPRPPTAPILI